MIPKTSEEYVHFLENNCERCEHYSDTQLGDCVIDKALTAFAAVGEPIPEDIKALLGTSNAGCPRLREREVSR